MSRKEPRLNNQILEEASTWFVAFRSQDVADNARQDFREWLKTSPEHIRAYLQIASVYADIPAPEHGRTPPELVAKARSSPDVNVFALNASKTIDLTSRYAVPPSRELRMRLFASRVAVAVSVLIFALTGAWLYADRNTYRTGIGEQRSITMADGSIVELNALSKVRIAFRDEQRDVELLEGQALFRVAKDHSRPFVVHAGTTSVRAVGTQFDVYRKSSGTIVTVLEGRVAVLAPEDPTQVLIPEPRPHPQTSLTAPTISREVLLAAGEQMTVTPTHAQKAERPNIAAATAWTQHQLVFDGMPLAQVLEEFSRYSTRRLIIASPELAELKISGQYTSTNPDSLLRFLSLQNGVVITQVNGDTHIRQE